MEILTGETELLLGAKKLAENGPSVVLISLGSRGVFFYCRKGYQTIRTYDVNTIDTTGTGDAFLGAVHNRLAGKIREDLQNISVEELRDIVEFANAAGSLTTTKNGAIPAMPKISDILELKKSGLKLDVNDPGYVKTDE